MVNLKLLPLPNSLSTQIWPPCFSTKSLHSINPKPVPVSSLVPDVVFFWLMSNRLALFSGAMPMPLSFTENTIWLLSFVIESSTLPLVSVNFMAFEMRLRKMVPNMSLSAKTYSSFFISDCMLMFLLLAILSNRFIVLSTIGLISIFLGINSRLPVWDCAQVKRLSSSEYAFFEDL